MIAFSKTSVRNPATQKCDNNVTNFKVTIMHATRASSGKQTTAYV